MKGTWKGFGISGALILGVGLSGCGSTHGSYPAAGTSATGNKTDATATGTGTPSSVSKKVTIGYVNWAEDVAVTELWKNLLEKKGYQVETKSLDAGPLFVGLSEGGINFFLDTWLPYTHKAYLDKYGSQLSDLGIWYKGEAKEGIVVPNYVTIKSVEDLNANASKFNNQIVGIDPGAGLMKLTKKAADDYGIKLNVESGSETAMITALKRAISKNEWIAVTGWSPHWMFSKYQLKYLEDPKGDFGKSEELHAEANKEWANSNPEVANWLKKFKVTSEQLGTLEDDLNSASSKDEGLKKWIGDNQSLVNSWFQ